MAEWWCADLPPERLKEYGPWCPAEFEPLIIVGMVVFVTTAYTVVLIVNHFYGPTLTVWDRKLKMKMKMREDERAVSPVVGVILMVAITVVLAAIVFVLVNNLGKQSGEDRPDMAFTALNATVLQVVQAPTGLDWSDFTVTGCATIPTGAVDAGDRLEACGSTVTVRHVPSNSLVYSR